MTRKRAFKTRHFPKFASNAGLTDTILCDATVREMEQGVIHADLGGGVVKGSSQNSYMNTPCLPRCQFMTASW
ncbi:MAG: type II toxin-antitoxin system RelE/ParE family toxin [Giesbergeria sp.]|uniref:type II toxin-antitoxin system RelE/ParE family toxin n=1 Tax=Giesbergeria sp. TaxID=2818473 RepID=UPI00260CBDB8|nr:type II toxin-antitoxin system RelE/ParE family toxin [Giesbergeria sp.]MDD2610209.1 type II toxin-antitoxin system RelE/ParE family toxin [Giesbergeria sp.]